MKSRPPEASLSDQTACSRTALGTYETREVSRIPRLSYSSRFVPSWLQSVSQSVSQSQGSRSAQHFAFRSDHLHPHTETPTSQPRAGHIAIQNASLQPLRCPIPRPQHHRRGDCCGRTTHVPDACSSFPIGQPLFCSRRGIDFRNFDICCVSWLVLLPAVL